MQLVHDEPSISRRVYTPAEHLNREHHVPEIAALDAKFFVPEPGARFARSAMDACGLPQRRCATADRSRWAGASQWDRKLKSAFGVLGCAALIAACDGKDTGSSSGRAQGVAGQSSVAGAAETRAGASGGALGAAGDAAADSGTAGAGIAVPPGGSGDSGMPEIAAGAIAVLLPLPGSTIDGMVNVGAGGAGGHADAAGSGGDLTAGGSAAPRLPVRGMIAFRKISGGVNMTISLLGCADGKSYPIHIHEGASCDPMSQGAHWDPPRGEGIPDLECQGFRASASYTRASSDAKPWTIGDPAASNVVGHVMVLHDADDPTKRIECGQIVAQ